MNIKNLTKYFLIALPYLVVFICSLYQPYDNDLGWHLAYGKYFFDHHSILRTNIFSTEMPSYHWVNSSWLTDLISYVTFNHFGFLGLSALSAVIITATFYFFAESLKIDYFEKALIFPVLLYLLWPLNSVSFRGQLASLLLLGILTSVLTKYLSQNSKPLLFERSHVHETERAGVENYNSSHKTSRFNRIRSFSRRINELYLLPALFVLWSNLHGEFILGLAVFAIMIAADIGSNIVIEGIKNTKAILGKRLKLIGIFFICALAAVINPFGIGVYIEAVKHFGDPLQGYIIEWLAFSTLSNYWWQEVVVGLIAFFGLLFLIFSAKFKDFIPQISIASILYLIAFKVRRFIWPAYYFGMVLLAPVAAFFKPESKKYQTISATVILVLFVAATFFTNNPIRRIKAMSWQTYCTRFVQCSDGAIKYIDANHLDVIDPEGLRPERANLLTYYGWGGYLIWNWPQVKPSIDGRMHLWRDDKEYSAFETYFAYEQNTEDIDKSTYDVVLMTPQKPVYSRLNELVTQGTWQKVYEDKDAGVFVRTNGYIRSQNTPI